MKILYATDGSETALSAIDWIRSLAKRNPVDLTIMSVRYGAARYSMHPWYQEWIESEKKQAESILKDARDQLKDVCRKTILLDAKGAVVPAIVDQAEEMKADLVVMGAIGHSAVERVLLGSVSDSVATHVGCSVLITRPSRQPVEHPANILLGFDQSVASREAICELSEWDLPAETEVHFLSVVERQPLIFDNGIGTTFTTPAEPQIREYRESADRLASSLADGIPNTTTDMVIARHTGQQLVETAGQKNCDLIVVGDKGHGLLADLFLGGTTKYVLRHAPCSVWVSRHHTKCDSDHEEVQSQSNDAVTVI